MALLLCPECKKPLSTKAASCPNCGYVQKKKKGGCGQFIIILIGVLLLLFMIKMCTSNPNASSASKSFDHSEGTAYQHAEERIEKLLKSPKSAEFPKYREHYKHVVRNGGGEYTINSYVDSQNSFGALIRTQWSCKVTYTKDKVRITDVRIE